MTGTISNLVGTAFNLGTLAVQLAPGAHTIMGKFAWGRLPEAIHLPRDVALVELGEARAEARLEAGLRGTRLAFHLVDERRERAHDLVDVLGAHSFLCSLPGRGFEHGALELPYHAAGVNAVLAPSGDPVEVRLALRPPVTVRVLQDGAPLDALHAGADIAWQDGQPVLVVNRPGAGQTVAMNVLGTKQRDPHTRGSRPPTRRRTAS